MREACPVRGSAEIHSAKVYKGRRDSTQDPGTASMAPDRLRSLQPGLEMSSARGRRKPGSVGCRGSPGKTVFSDEGNNQR